MVTPLSLFLFATATLLLAIVVGWLRQSNLRDLLGDGLAALTGVAVVLVSSVILFAISDRLRLSQPWFDAGAVTLLASPLGATVALRFRGRRSMPRALVASIVAIVGVVLWLTLNLRGPNGGWILAEVLIVLPAAVL